MYKILIYDCLKLTGASMISALQDRCELTCITNENEFQAEIKTRQFDLIFLDIDSLEGSPMELLAQIHNKDPFLPIIMVSKAEKAEIIVQAMNDGASDFLIHPISPTRINIAVDKAIQIRDQRFEIAYHRRKQDVVYDFKDVVAYSRGMQQILKSLERFARTDSTILITGDTGTGKSFLSGTVHFNSPRRKKPFVKINCANIPEDLLESELFGHEKGAFTGAVKRKLGKFEIARGGTIFLDEIATVTPAVQIKLLQVLQDRTFQRVGGEAPIDADARIIAATNFDLKAMCEAKEFRNDLYYRLNVFPIELPPLRDRLEDIPLLVEIFLKRLNLLYSAEIVSLHPLVLEAFQEYRWPGNIRELENLVERAFILENSDTLTPESFPAELFVGLGRAPSVAMDTSLTLAETRRRSLDLIERKYLKEVLSEQNGRIGQTASMAGITPRQLHKLMKKYDLRKENFK